MQEEQELTNRQAGGKEAAKKNTSRDPDFYRKIGSKGGKKQVAKGFATFPFEKVSAAGKLGGRISRRKKKSE